MSSYTDSLTGAVTAAAGMDRGPAQGGPGKGVLGGKVIGGGIPADDTGWSRIVDAHWPFPVVVEILATGPAPGASHRWEIRIRTQTGLSGPILTDALMATRAEYSIPAQYLTIETRAAAGEAVTIACAPQGIP